GQEGIEARCARHEAMRARVELWVRETGLPLGILAHAGQRSATVTAISLPAGGSGTVVVEALRRRGYVIGAGYGKLREATIRIGHMGDHTVAGLDRCLEELGEVLGAS
ncbi:MAG: hypothetical protein ACREL2_01055, partial [Gemmatimonadales bacterium]